MPARKEIGEFRLDDDIAIAVEVKSADKREFQNISTRGGAREKDDKAPRSFQEALDRVRPMTNQLIDRLRGLAQQPDNIEVEFGIKLNGEVGVLLASTGTEAHFTIKLSWSNGKE